MADLTNENEQTPTEGANDQEQTKQKRVRVTFTKNVKLNGDRIKKGDSLLLEKEKAEEFKEKGVIE